MRCSIACFTDRGEALATRLAEALTTEGDAATVVRCGDGRRRLNDWARDAFGTADALIVIGAAGIAVRAIAPHIAAKTADPAVVVVDDAGRFAVSILSGHIGGANALTNRIARMLGATPVVTTATDGAHVFAVDVWATALGWHIANPDRIKVVSARLLAGREVRVKSSFPVDGPLPDGLVLAEAEYDMYIDVHENPRPEALHIVPPVLVLGVGCRRGVGEAAIMAAFDALRRDTGIVAAAIGAVCSIAVKKDEPGLLAFCRRLGLDLAAYDAAELAAVTGTFAASAFVEAAVGVDNVCERSAVLGSGGGAVTAAKRALDGVTMALAMTPTTMRFTEE